MSNQVSSQSRALAEDFKALYLKHNLSSLRASVSPADGTQISVNMYESLNSVVVNIEDAHFTRAESQFSFDKQ